MTQYLNGRRTLADTPSDRLPGYQTGPFQRDDHECEPPEPSEPLGIVHIGDMHWVDKQRTPWWRRILNATKRSST